MRGDCPPRFTRTAPSTRLFRLVPCAAAPLCFIKSRESSKTLRTRANKAPMNLEKIVGIHDRMPEAAHFPLDSGAAQLMQLREFPKACQTPALRPALPQQYLSVLLNGYQLFLQAYGFHTPGSDRKLRFASGLPRLALLSQRAKGTLRLFRQAYHGAQLHQGLIEFSRALGVEESIRQLTKP